MVRIRLTSETPHIDERAIADYVDRNIDEFHRRRHERLKTFDLASLLARKNPYLMQLEQFISPRDLIKPMLDAHLSSQEEGMLDDFLKGLAIEAARIAYDGRTSEFAGIDLEFDNGDTRYIISIKSGPNWGNSSQVNKMRSDFTNAARVIRQGNPSQHVVAVNGCCYGKTSPSYDKGDYLKLAGKAFWQLITGDESFYLRIVKPIEILEPGRTTNFAASKGAVLLKLENEFATEYCDPETGRINWSRLVLFSSGTAAEVKL